MILFFFWGNLNFNLNFETFSFSSAPSVYTEHKRYAKNYNLFSAGSCHLNVDFIFKYFVLCLLFLTVGVFLISDFP